MDDDDDQAHLVEAARLTALFDIAIARFDEKQRMLDEPDWEPSGAVMILMGE